MTTWQFWIDRGGTFTDIVALSSDGEILSRKFLSDNPEHYQDAAVYGIREILGDSEAEISSVKMGTTVGTNALLERRGAKLAFVTNRGFKDCLFIAYQNRPDIFALNIERVKPLYDTVLELDVRVNAQGEVLQELDLKSAYHQLQLLYREGVRVLAIALIHAWRYPQHELALAKMARHIGFVYVALSHRVSPLPKLISRGDTTVVDAYLSPILHRYIKQVMTGLGDDVRLLFMQSNGGLVAAKQFRGKDCVLSGPAGGIVGASVIAGQAGFKKIIAFDMGGTSTDVAHYAGELECTTDTEISGIRIRTPMMAIHTVAAGGGSLLHFNGLRYRVGPESAGANPGPACYRRGGGLTVTDANLMLGKLPNFPAVFGKDGNLPPDAEKVAELFNELALKIGDKRSPEQVAEGFLTIAVENMAAAIKKISVQKGYDLSDYALCCYGAAGAQHACKIAERLGIKTVLLHPFAGVLSAYGMGLADFRVLHEQALEQPWQTVSQSDLNKHCQTLEQQGRNQLIAQGLNEQHIISHWRVALRFQGTDNSLWLAVDNKTAMLKNFRASYQQHFGFCYDRPVLVSSVAVECIGIEDHAPIQKLNTEQRTGSAAFRTKMFSNNQWHDTPVYSREQLNIGQIITGAAIITEPTSTIVIEPHWQGQLHANGNIVLNRVQDDTQTRLQTDKADPVQLEIFNKLFMSIAEQMGFVLQNTAHSVNIKERLDFSCALFDAKGQLIANAPHIPVHLGSMGDSVQTILNKDLQAGDVYLINSPYSGGTHLPDITVITPVFSEDGSELLFFTASRGHHADVGGIVPSSMPAHSQHIDEEGIISDGLKIVSRGELQEQVLRDWLKPARNIEQNLADLQAQIAANRKGATELLAMVARYSLPVVQAYMQFVQDNAEAAVCAVIKTLKNGSFSYQLDQGAEIKVSINIDNDNATIDFSGTSEQLSDNFNAPLSVCKAAVLYVFRTLVKDDIPLNAGCLKPLTLIIPEGSLLNPCYPAAVVAGNVETSQYIVDALYGALGVLAGSQGTMNNLTFGTKDYQYYETICGGAGAGNGFHGASAIHTHMTNSRLTDPEILEARFPVLLERFAVRANSGGKGKYHGGDGVIRRIKFLQSMDVSILSSHRLYPPFGLNGGNSGRLGVNYLIHNGKKQILPANISLSVEANDSIEIQTPSGGGFGK